jgi:hypothetical protein
MSDQLFCIIDVPILAAFKPEGPHNSMIPMPAAGKSPWKFFSLVFVISVPFWLVGTVVNHFLPKAIAINLPFAAMMFVCPAAVAFYLSYQENGSKGTAQLLKKTFDYPKIKQKIWYIPILLFWPLVMILAYLWMKFTGYALPSLHYPDWLAPVSLVLFFIAAAGEELGWMGYAIDPLQERWSALGAAIILGAVWAIWHIIPYIQAHQTANWIFWQCLATMATRIIMVWLYNNTGKSVFAAILFHAIYNTITLVFPNYGFIFNPFIYYVLIAVSAAIVIFLWGPGTMAHYRYARYM